MSDRIIAVTFNHEDDLVHATNEARKQGFHIFDAYTPFAVHGLDDAMGLPPSRLTWVCFACGIAGALGMLWFEHWAAASSWGLNVGGKPWNSLPSDVPVAFEAAVLLAGFGSVFALLGVSRLFPGRKAIIVSSRVTDDQFVLVIRCTDARYDLARVDGVMRANGAVRVDECLQNESGSTILC